MRFRWAALNRSFIWRGKIRTCAGTSMLDALSRVPDMRVRLTFGRDLARESGTGHSVGDWWVMYSHVTPDTVAVRVNLAAGHIDVSQLELTLAPQPHPQPPAP